jgi:YjbE family integral membrane protein
MLLLDWGSLLHVTFNAEFVVGFISIVLIDLVLAGDNAVVIAMAVRSLPRSQRLKGIAFGAGAAVALRVVLTFFAAQLLQMQYVKLIGGIVILWIAVKLFIEGVPDEDGKKDAKTLWQAVWIIVIADITMSTDNVLAVAGASRGSLFLLIFGLGLSIPLVVFTSNLIANLMDRYPIIIYIGAAVLGRVGGEMMITDPFVVRMLNPAKWLQYGVEAVCTAGVIAAGIGWKRLMPKERRENNRGEDEEACISGKQVKD